MAWYELPQGRTAAEMASMYHVPVYDIPAHLVRSNNNGEQWSEAVRALSGAIGQYLLRQRNDEIANQLMEQHGITGVKGEEGLRQYMALKQFENENALDQARLAKLTGGGGGGGGGGSGRSYYPVTLPDGGSVNVTGNALLRYMGKQSQKMDKYLGMTPELATAPGYARYIDPSGKQISTEEAELNPDEVKVDVPGYPHVLTYRQYKAGLETYLGNRGNVNEKVLDDQTARGLLQEAGGDVEKARQLARSRGFKF